MLIFYLNEVNIMKKNILISSLIFLLLSYMSLYGLETDIKNIDAVLSEIRVEQGLKDNEKINPDKVSPKLLEELGDSVMEKTIGNHDRHEQMDKMMGGDGSASLTAMHQGIGYSYLTGNYNGMMGYGGMMHGYPDKFRGGHMMWNNGYGMGYGGGWILGILAFIVIVVLTGLVIYFALRNNRKTDSNTDKPVDILKTRFAKGEISKDEFDKIKKELEN
jgi:putative membrane protein